MFLKNCVFPIQLLIKEAIKSILRIFSAHIKFHKGCRMSWNFNLIKLELFALYFKMADKRSTSVGSSSALSPALEEIARLNFCEKTTR